MSGTNKIGSVYFSHPTEISEDGKKAIVFLGSVFENRFDDKDPRKELSLTRKVGDTFVRATGIRYGEGEDAVVVEIPSDAYIKVKVGENKKPSGNTATNPGKF